MIVWEAEVQHSLVLINKGNKHGGFSVACVFVPKTSREFQYLSVLA